MGNFRSINAPKIIQCASEAPMDEVINICKANSEHYGKENVNVKVELKFSQIGKAHHIEAPHFAELIDVLYRQPNNDDPKNSFINPYDTDTTVEALPLFEHAFGMDFAKGCIPARDTEDLKLYFSTPFVNNKKWVQFFGPGTRFDEVEGVDDFKLYIGSLCDPEKAKAYKSKHCSDQEPEAEQTKRVSPHQVIIVWVVGDGAEQDKAHAEAVLSHETDDEGRGSSAEKEEECKKPEDKVDKKKKTGLETSEEPAAAEAATEAKAEKVDKKKAKKEKECQKTEECDKAAHCDKTAEEKAHTEKPCEEECKPEEACEGKKECHQEKECEGGLEAAPEEKKKKRRSVPKPEATEEVAPPPADEAAPPAAEEDTPAVTEDGEPVEKKKKKRRPKSTEVEEAPPAVDEEPPAE